MSQENQKKYFSATAQPLRIDREQATTQLETLGDSRGEAISVLSWGRRQVLTSNSLLSKQQEVVTQFEAKVGVNS